jgi:hypothetical protein
MVTNLFLWRRVNGWTQVRAARELRIGRNLYVGLESGRLAPTPTQFKPLQRYFGPRKASSMLAVVRLAA